MEVLERFKRLIKNKKNAFASLFLVVLMLISNIPAQEISALESENSVIANRILNLKKEVINTEDELFNLTATFDENSEVADGTKLSTNEVRSEEHTSELQSRI